MSPSVPPFVTPIGLAAFAAVAMAVVILLIRTAVGSRDAAERARLFEMGYYLPRRPSRWPQAIFCTAMGLGVPIVALGIAGAQRGGPDEVWIIACIVSVAAVAGATIVAGIVFSRPEPSAEPQQLATGHAKPAMDPEALDFAGRLGRG